jgi:catechol 2,3-dioxygenase-like lactoylglutathione lyase family enzyme
MGITVDHIVLPAHDNEAAARFFAHIMGVAYDGPDRHFAPVPINDTFTVTFMTAADVPSVHLGFHVTEAAFVRIVGNLQAGGVPYGNDPRELENGRTDHPFGGQGLYFVDPNGHLFEVMTQRAPADTGV